MLRIRDILHDKEKGRGNDVWSIGPAHSVYQAIEMMALKEVGALPVLGDTGQLVGIISERDYARKVILQGKSSHQTAVSEIMTHSVITVNEDAQIQECMSLMTNRRVRHLPVMQGSKLVAMVSVGDMVKTIITEQDYKIEQLERYVRGEEAGSIH